MKFSIPNSLPLVWVFQDLSSPFWSLSCHKSEQVKHSRAACPTLRQILPWRWQQRSPNADFSWVLRGTQMFLDLLRTEILTFHLTWEPLPSLLFTLREHRSAEGYRIIRTQISQEKFRYMKNQTPFCSSTAMENQRPQKLQQQNNENYLTL